MRQIHITVMQPFADLGDTDMMFNLGAMLAGSDPGEAQLLPGVGPIRWPTALPPGVGSRS